MNAGLQTSADYLELWHAYLSFLRRQIDFSKDNKNSGEEEKIESLRETFQFAINQLYECKTIIFREFFYLFLNYGSFQT